MKALLRCSDRQVQILELAAQGRSDKEIAISLGISIHTIRTHLQRLYRSAGLSNRAEAVAAWLANQVTAAPVPPAPELPVQVVAAGAQHDLVNQERSANDLPPLRWDADLAALAEAGARRMAECGHLATVLDGTPAPLPPGVRAENVGYWSGINDAQLHLLFMANPGQRANLLGDHQSIGAAWAVTASGVAFLSVVFA